MVSRVRHCEASAIHPHPLALEPVSHTRGDSGGWGRFGVRKSKCRLAAHVDGRDVWGHETPWLSDPGHPDPGRPTHLTPDAGRGPGLCLAAGPGRRRGSAVCAPRSMCAAAATRAMPDSAGTGCSARGSGAAPRPSACSCTADASARPSSLSCIPFPRCRSGGRGGRAPEWALSPVI